MEDDVDLRIKQLVSYITKMRALPLGGKSTMMGAKWPITSLNNKLESSAYDEVMNFAESELQDLLVRKNRLYAATSQAPPLYEGGNSTPPYFPFGSKYGVQRY